jgi:hypothetical protein
MPGGTLDGPYHGDIPRCLRYDQRQGLELVCQEDRFRGGPHEHSRYPAGCLRDAFLWACLGEWGQELREWE